MQDADLMHTSASPPHKEPLLPERSPASDALPCGTRKATPLLPFAPFLSWLVRIFQGLAGWMQKIFGESIVREDEGGGNLDPSQPVQVYILLGQSNMLGMGRVNCNTDGTLDYAVHSKGLYRYLVNDDGSWSTSESVRNVRVMSSGNGGMRVYHNEFLTIRGDTIGPEIDIGHCLEAASTATPIMLLKSCIGNRSLGWDLLPPGSPKYDFNGRTYAGYKDSPASWPSDQPKPDPIGWYAGLQYDADIANAKSVLAELDRFYPDASLRVEFKAPQAKFVLATLGQTALSNASGTEQPILDGMLAVDGNSGRYSEFSRNVATVYSHPLSKGGSSNAHYNGNAETYMNIGEAMGRAMLDLNNNTMPVRDEAHGQMHDLVPVVV